MNWPPDLKSVSCADIVNFKGDRTIVCGSLTSGRQLNLCIHNASHWGWKIYSNRKYHFPFMGMQPIKKKGSKKVACNYFPNMVLHSPFLPRQTLFIVFLRVSFILLLSTFSKSERRPPLPCHIHSSVMNGSPRRTQQQSLSINVLFWLALFYPKAKTFRPVLSSSCVWTSPLLLCSCASLQRIRSPGNTQLQLYVTCSLKSKNNFLNLQDKNKNFRKKTFIYISISI